MMCRKIIGMRAPQAHGTRRSPDWHFWPFFRIFSLFQIFTYFYKLTRARVDGARVRNFSGARAAIIRESYLKILSTRVITNMVFFTSFKMSKSSIFGEKMGKNGCQKFLRSPNLLDRSARAPQIFLTNVGT